MAPQRILVHGGLVFTMRPGENPRPAQVLLEGGVIRALGPGPFEPEVDLELDATGAWVLPGFIQGHVHLCQTLFRSRAEDLPLLAWLRERIWPLEAAHDEETLRAATRLGLAELIAGGTTTLLDMGTVHHHHVVCEEILAAGVQAISGKAMMDSDPQGVTPPALREDRRTSLADSLALARRFHGAGQGRLHYALAPRFALSCSRELLEESAHLARQHGLGIHTHGSESRQELAALRRACGCSNMVYLERCGLLGTRTVIAHGVHLEEGEIELLASRDAAIAHCPAANLKLGSGIAPVAQLLAGGVRVALGSDGAPCNNRLDIFREMYLAGALAAIEAHPGALGARRVLALATREGARALGLEKLCGTLETGKRADVLILRPDPLAMAPVSDPFAAMVYSASAERIETVLAGGRVLKLRGELVDFDPEEVARRAGEAAQTLASRAGML